MADRFGIGKEQSGRVVVVGSLNMDLILRTARFPEPGESVTGWGYRTLPGGKGANQAVAAARQGAHVEMVGCVGQDPFGEALLESLRAAEVGMAHLRRASTATGVAMVAVAPDGESRIIVVPGANRATTPEQVEAAAPLIADADWLLVQLEVPMETVEAAAAVAARVGTPLLLNPSPVPTAGLPEGLLEKVELLVPNRIEAQRLTGEAEPERAARRLRAMGVRKVIVTLGEEGAIIVTRRGTLRVEPFAVEAVDTTAAGDAFVGALVAALTRGERLRDAALYGAAAGALAVTQVGAQGALPALDEVEAMVAERQGRLPADYPEELSEIATDKKGDELLLRPIHIGDAAGLQRFFEALSPESRYRRFFTHRRTLPDNEARELASVDYHERLALVASPLDEPERIIGVARYARTEGRPGAVEMAIVIGDDFQGRGIGTMLMRRLVEAARERGHRWMLAETHFDNAGMVKLAQAMGRPIERESEGDLLKLWLKLEG